MERTVLKVSMSDGYGLGVQVRESTGGRHNDPLSGGESGDFIRSFITKLPHAEGIVRDGPRTASCVANLSR